MNIKNNIILALDVTNGKKAFNICEKIEKTINTIKIGYPLTLSEGLEIIKTIKENFNYNIICDYKVADIPITNKKICDLTFQSNADAIICHGFTGKDSIESCKKSANEHEKEIFLLTEMSHPGAKMFLQNNANEIAKMGLEMKIKNYVAPATRINRLKEIRNILGQDKFIIAPGIGKQGGNIKETLQYANAVIIGRSIYESKYPQKTIEKFIKEKNC